MPFVQEQIEKFVDIANPKLINLGMTKFMIQRVHHINQLFHMINSNNPYWPFYWNLS